MYVLFLLLPGVIALIFRFAWPLAENLIAGLPLSATGGFDLSQFRHWLGIIMVYLAPQLLGMPLGFRLLEEKDQGTLAYYPVTPPGLTGYVGILGMMCMLAILIFHLVLPALLPFAYHALLPEGAWPRYFGVGVLASMEGLIFALTLSFVARDKVEGMTVGKGLSLLTAVPVLALLFPHWFAGPSWAWLITAVPWAWPVLILNAGVSGLPWFAAAAGVHLVWLGLLVAGEFRAMSRGRE
jgi:fluoroquinolone transport system permease protein